jgi:hypothetical protein
VPSRYRSKNFGTPLDPASRAISIRQLERLGALIERMLRKYYPKRVYDDNGEARVVGQLTKINISMYEINELFVKPLTNNCSFVEMVAKRPQPPNL